jgi:Pentapeptide repeats (8 copies)
MTKRLPLALASCLVTVATASAGPVVVVDQQRGRGLARLRGDECFVLTPAHVLSQSSRRPGRNVEVIGPEGARGQAVFAGTVGSDEDDVVMLRLTSNAAAVCADPDVQRLKGIDEPTLVLRESSGGLSFVPVAVNSTDRRAIGIRSSSEFTRISQMMSGALLVDAGQEQGILIRVAAEPDGIAEVRSLEYIAGLMGAWVKGSAGNLTEVRNTLEVLQRAAEAKPTGDIGQVAAAEQHVRQGLAFDAMQLQGIFLNGAALPDARFSRARLHGASFVRAGLARASFTEAVLTFADLTGAQAEGASFAGAYLPYVDAPGANLAGADLSRSNWFAARLENTNLSGANLAGASLAYADLRNADLRRADLTNAVLVGAVLTGARLEGTKFSNTDISSATGIVPEAPLKAPQVCARKGAGYVQLEIMEATPSTRFDSGFSYERLPTGRDDGPSVPGGSHHFNEICATVPDGLQTRVDSPVFRNEHSRDLGFGLLSSLVRTGGRGQKYLARVREHAEFLRREVRPDTFLRTGSARIDALAAALRKTASANVTRPAADCFDGDSYHLLATSFTPSLTAEQWAQLASARRSHEETAGKYMSRMTAGKYRDDLLPWGRFFPDDFDARDVGPRVVEVFRVWNQKRVKAQDRRITFCLGGSLSSQHLNNSRGWAQEGRSPDADQQLRALGLDPETLIVLRIGGGYVFGQRIAFVLDQPLPQPLLASRGRSASRDASAPERTEIQIQVTGLEQLEGSSELPQERLVVVRGRVQAP